MQKTLGEIAQIIDGELVGDASLIITGVNGIQEAKEGDLTFISDTKYLPYLEETEASAIITSQEVDTDKKAIIRTSNPSAAFSKIITLFTNDRKFHPQGIHKTACIATNVSMAPNVAIGPNAVIESGVHLGEDTIVHAGAYVGAQSKIGKGCFVHPNVTIRECTEIGDRVTIHAGTVIGSDGFGYNKIDGTYVKIPQNGIVVIEDDVEIGANVTIDRARFDKTIIGRGTKIDNLVQIAHNVIIGEDCVLISQAGIAGSAKIGKGAIVAGQSGVSGHLTIGEGAIVAAKTGVTKSVPPFEKVIGFPAREHSYFVKLNAIMKKLPDYIERIQELEEKVKNLEGK